MSTRTMSVSGFVMEATKCSGRIQRMLAEDAVDTSAVMDALALREVYATTTDKADRQFDIVRLGVEEDGTLRVEVVERWTLSRKLLVGIKALVVVILVGIAFIIGGAL